MASRQNKAPRPNLPFESLTPVASKQLLNRLYAHQDNPDFHYTHDWRVGDLVVWDNRPTMHRRESFPENERRLMWRTQIHSDRAPVA